MNKPIIAYRTTTGLVVHNRCLHPMQKPHREMMKASKLRDTPANYPAVEAALHPGHPCLPRGCDHCHELIQKEA